MKIDSRWRAHGIAVLVDAAQSVGYMDVNFAGWGFDFLAMSMHKGIGAPLATGVLVIWKDWLGKLEPRHPPTWDTSKYPVDQYAWTGTANVAAQVTLPDAIAAQEHIGVARKRSRLMHLAAVPALRQRRARLAAAVYDDGGTAAVCVSVTHRCSVGVSHGSRRCCAGFRV